eukprot:485183_1
MDEITRDYTKSDYILALMKCRNAKSYYGSIHILFMKFTIQTTWRIWCTIYNYWKDSGTNTQMANESLMNPIPKDGKPSHVVKGLRPIQYAKNPIKVYAQMNTSRIMDYVIEERIIEKEQFAAKTGTGASDCIISMGHVLSEQINSGWIAWLTAFDSSDAFNAQINQFILDKFYFHVGLRRDALKIIESMQYNARMKVQVNDTRSESRVIKSSAFYQGYVPSALVYCIYVNPMLKAIKRNYRMNTMQLRIQVIPFMLMDDITLILSIMRHAESNEWDESWGSIINKTQATLGEKMKRNKEMLDESTQRAIIAIYQEAIDYVKRYLNTNNICTNDDKTKQVRIHDREFSNKKKDDAQWKERDKLRLLRDHQFIIDDKKYTPDPDAKILGFIFDENMKLEKQVQKVINAMQSAYLKVKFMMKKNRLNLRMDVVKEMIETVMLVHLNYSGPILLPLISDELKQKLSEQYYRCITLMIGEIRFLNHAEIAMFNGFKIFSTKCEEILAKQFSRFMRSHRNNYLHDLVPKYMKTFTRFDDRNRCNIRLSDDQIDHCHFRRALNAKERTDVIWSWYQNARVLKTDDSKLYQYGMMIPLKDKIATPHCSIPNNIKVRKKEDGWKDEEITENHRRDHNALYIASDGSVYYDDKRKKMYGKGGGALTIYEHNSSYICCPSTTPMDCLSILSTTTLPISTRTHINVCEFIMVLTALQWITAHDEWLDDNEIDAIYVLTDSENCKNIINLKSIPKDEAINAQMIQLYELYKKMHTMEWCGMIEIIWVKAHDKNELNNEVDIMAKSAAVRVDTLAEFIDKDGAMKGFFPNNFIGYQTVKAEIKFKARLRDEGFWNGMKRGLKNEAHGCHLYLWNIRLATSTTIKELAFYTLTQNQVRILLYTAKFPTRVYLQELTSQDVEIACEFCDLDDEIEDLGHLLCVCPTYAHARRMNHRAMEMIYKEHNDEMKADGREEYTCHQTNQDKMSVDYIKQFLFPPTFVSIQRRARLNLLLINYMIDNFGSRIGQACIWYKKRANPL